MSDAAADPPPCADADSEMAREIRRGRTFSMAEALGRLAGPGGMKGAAPISRLQQAQAVIEHLIRQRLDDATGILSGVLIRDVGDSSILLEHLDQPQVAVIEYVRRLLSSREFLRELVRTTDVEWGRVLGERPYFEQVGCAPHPDDPYTEESVSAALCRLQELLET